MNNQIELLEYIRSEQMRGNSKEQIIAHLVTSGWPADTVGKAFDDLQKHPTLVPGAPAVPRKERHPFRFLVALLAFIAAMLALLGALINVGLITPPVQQVPFDLPFSVDTQTLATTSPTLAPIVSTTTPAQLPGITPAPTAPVQPAQSAPAAGLSADDRSQIIVAILTQNSVFSSGNASSIRNYLSVFSPSMADDFAAMSDSQVISYAQSLMGVTANITSDQLSSSAVSWQESGSAVTLTIPTGSSTATRSSTEVNGVWY